MATEEVDLDWDLREVAWSRSALVSQLRDRQMERVHPDLIHVPEGMTPRSQSVLDNLRTTMSAMGQLVPLLVNEDFQLMDGVSRLVVARELGLTEVMVVRFERLSDLEMLIAQVAANSELTRSHYTVLESYELWKRVQRGLADRAQRNVKQTQFGGEVGAGQGQSADRVHNSWSAASKVAGISVGTVNQLSQLEGWAEQQDVAPALRAAARDALARIAESNVVKPHWSHVRKMADELVVIQSQVHEADGFAEADRFQRALSRAEELMMLDLDRARRFLEASGQLAGYEARVRALATALTRFAGMGER